MIIKKGILYGVGVGPGSAAYDASCRQNNKKLLSHDRPISAVAEKFSSDQSDKMIALPDK